MQSILSALLSRSLTYFSIITSKFISSLIHQDNSAGFFTASPGFHFHSAFSFSKPWTREISLLQFFFLVFFKPTFTFIASSIWNLPRYTWPFCRVFRFAILSSTNSSILLFSCSLISAAAIRVTSMSYLNVLFLDPCPFNLGHGPVLGWTSPRWNTEKVNPEGPDTTSTPGYHSKSQKHRRQKH